MAPEGQPALLQRDVESISGVDRSEQPGRWFCLPACVAAPALQVARGEEAARNTWDLLDTEGSQNALGFGTVADGVWEAVHVETVRCEAAHSLDGPFTTGNIARQSFERVLPNTFVEPTPTDHFPEAERRGRLVPDRHPDEHATC